MVLKPTEAAPVLALAEYLGAMVLGYLVGRLGRRPPPTLFMALVAVLIFVVSASLSPAMASTAASTVLTSLVYALALVLAPAALGMVAGGEPAQAMPPRPYMSLIASSALVAGLACGALVRLPYGHAVEPLLLALLFAAGMDMAHVQLKLRPKLLYAPITSLATSAAVGLAFWMAADISPAVALGMGWYSFTGPYLVRQDELQGAYGLLVNFLREQLTYLLAPLLARRSSPVAVLAMGGATTMDNTLPLYVALYGPAFAVYAVANGVVLTVAVPVLVPLASPA